MQSKYSLPGDRNGAARTNGRVTGRIELGDSLAADQVKRQVLTPSNVVVQRPRVCALRARTLLAGVRDQRQPPIRSVGTRSADRITLTPSTVS